MENLKKLLRDLQSACAQLESKKQLRYHDKIREFQDKLQNPDIDPCRTAKEVADLASPLNASMEGEEFRNTNILNAEVQVNGETITFGMIRGKIEKEIKHSCSE